MHEADLRSGVFNFNCECLVLPNVQRPKQCSQCSVCLRGRHRSGCFFRCFLLSCPKQISEAPKPCRSCVVVVSAIMVRVDPAFGQCLTTKWLLRHDSHWLLCRMTALPWQRLPFLVAVWDFKLWFQLHWALSAF